MRKATLLLFVMAAAARASSGCLVIDNFTQGKYRVRFDTASNNFTDSKRAQTGNNILGGVRNPFFLYAPNPSFGLIGELVVARDGAPLAVSMGPRAFFRLDLMYGLDANTPPMSAPLGYFPTGCDRFRVGFDSNSRVLNFNVEVFQTNGQIFLVGLNLVPNDTGLPFCVDFPFANFVTNVGPPQQFATNGIGGIDVIFQSGSAIGANDFAVTKFETVTPATAAASPCAFVAN